MNKSEKLNVIGLVAILMVLKQLMIIMQTINIIVNYDASNFKYISDRDYTSILIVNTIILLVFIILLNIIVRLGVNEKFYFNNQSFNLILFLGTIYFFYNQPFLGYIGMIILFFVFILFYKREQFFPFNVNSITYFESKNIFNLFRVFSLSIILYSLLKFLNNEMIMFFFPDRLSVFSFWGSHNTERVIWSIVLVLLLIFIRLYILNGMSRQHLTSKIDWGRFLILAYFFLILGVDDYTISFQSLEGFLESFFTNIFIPIFIMLVMTNIRLKKDYFKKYDIDFLSLVFFILVNIFGIFKCLFSDLYDLNELLILTSFIFLLIFTTYKIVVFQIKKYKKIMK